MSKFKIVKESVSAKDIAEKYGLKKMGKLYICPFHNDRSPSMQADERFYCHGCNATGDAVDLAAKILNLSLKDALERIVSDFSIQISDDNEMCEFEKMPDKEKTSREECIETVRKLIAYEKNLVALKETFKPKPEDGKMSQVFLYAQMKLDVIDDLIFRFYQNPTDEERKQLIKKSDEIMEGVLWLNDC